MQQQGPSDAQPAPLCMPATSPAPSGDRGCVVTTSSPSVEPPPAAMIAPPCTPFPPDVSHEDFQAKIYCAYFDFKEQLDAARSSQVPEFYPTAVAAACSDISSVYSSQDFWSLFHFGVRRYRSLLTAHQDLQEQGPQAKKARKSVGRKLRDTRPLLLDMMAAARLAFDMHFDTAPQPSGPLSLSPWLSLSPGPRHATSPVENFVPNPLRRSNN